MARPGVQLPGRAYRVIVASVRSARLAMQSPDLCSTTTCIAWYARHAAERTAVACPRADRIGRGQLCLLRGRRHRTRHRGHRTIAVRPGRRGTNRRPVRAGCGRRRTGIHSGKTDAAVMSVINENGVGVLLAAVEIASDPPSSDVSRRIGGALSTFAPAFEIFTTSRNLPRTGTGKIKRHEIEAAFRRLPAHGPKDGSGPMNK